MKEQSYPSDLSDPEWYLLEPLVPAAKPGGRHREVDMREIVNGIYYVLRSGGSWRMLPHDFPAWPTVYGYFRQWRKDHIWEQMNDALRGAVREQAERDPEPSAAIMDSQTVKTTEVTTDRGYDPGKKNQRAQTPSAGRRAGPGPDRAGPSSQCAGLCRG